MKIKTFIEYLEGNVKSKNTKDAYITALRKFNTFFNNNSFMHNNAKIEEVKPILQQELNWSYDPKKNEISNYRLHLEKKYPYLIKISKTEELSIDELDDLKDSMNIKGDPLLRAISKADGNGALSAVLGKLMEWKRYRNAEEDNLRVKVEEVNSEKIARNRIIYGAPGTGKSYLLEKEAEKFFGVVFKEVPESELDSNKRYWVGGAVWNGKDDQAQRFIDEGIWENGYDNKYLDKVNEVSKGDIFAIKSSYTRKKEGKTISVTKIKAIGEVVENLNDGKRLKIEWKHEEEKSYDEIGYLRTIHEVTGDHIRMFAPIAENITRKIEINPVERVTFYDGYTYGQFVGAYKPVPTEEGITYEYIPGPFLRQLMKAYKHPEHKFGLIIEEINRARADRVFGDIFQLLDRREDGSSRYKIALSEDQRKYINNDLCFEDEILVKDILNHEGIYIPENLYIWATMNSADQGVYHLDTAFKRRWHFEYIDLDKNKSEFDAENNGGKELVVFYQKNNENVWDYVSWNDFREVINDALMETGIHEDRLLAPFFVGITDFIRDEETDYGEADNIIELNSNVYINKVLVYLYDDLLRYKKRSNPIFRDYKSFSKLIKGYEEDESIFNEAVLKELNKKCRSKGFNITFSSEEE